MPARNGKGETGEMESWKWANALDLMTYVISWIVGQLALFVFIMALVAVVDVFRSRNEFSSAGGHILYVQSFFSIFWYRLIPREWPHALIVIVPTTVALFIGKLHSDSVERREAMKAGYGPDKRTWWKGTPGR